MNYLQLFIITASLLGTSSVDSAIIKQNYLTSDVVAQASLEEATDESQQSNGEDEQGNRFRLEVVIALLGAVGGALLKYAFDEMSQRNNFKRQMVTSVTKSIEDLAKNYYWLLANHSSVLSGLLERYLRERELKQLVLYESWEEAKQELDKIIERYGDDAFFYYSRFMKTIYNFQWITGNTYFLSNYDSGRTLTKLYNRLRILTKDIDANIIIDYIDKDLFIQTEENSPDPVNTKQELDTLHIFMEKLKKHERLNDEFENFKRWLRNEVELVWQASYCLKAYSDLFNAELGILYKDWFAKDAKGYLKKGINNGISREVLALVDSQESRDAISLVSLEPLTLRPIGLSTPQKINSAGAKEKKTSPKKTTEKDDKGKSSEQPVDSSELPKDRATDTDFKSSSETSENSQKLLNSEKAEKATIQDSNRSSSTAQTTQFRSTA